MNLSEYKDFHDYGLPKQSPGNENDIMENIQYLYSKMQKCTRNVTYFDLYRIDTIITQASEFESQINNLKPYSTAIVNIPFTTTTTAYSPGDMIVKKGDGSLESVFAQRGGIFFPYKIVKEEGNNTNNYTYDIYFKLESVSPSNDNSEANSKVVDNSQTWEASFAKNIYFNNLSAGSPASPYNRVLSYNNTFSIDAVMMSNSTTNPIEPIIHCYANNEEIYMDQQISYKTDSKQFEIKLYGNSTLCTKVVVK